LYLISKEQFEEVFFMLFLVKVRIDVAKMAEMGARLQSGELDKSNLRSTYCLRDDPAVGLNIWEADSEAEFNRVFAPHKEYYKEVYEVTPVITPLESMGTLSRS
jgi:hypothetical protein